MLDQQYKKLVEALLEVVSIPSIPVEVETTREGNFRGFDDGKLYVIESGSISARYHDKTVFVLQKGDLLLPDITGTADLDATVYYGRESGSSLESYPALEFMSRVFSKPTAIKLWITASLSQEDSQATPGFEVLVDDVTVGRIGEGEIFGAMAPLTHADRSATVRATTRCSVVKVPKEQFTELIKSNPATIHSLLIDMANSIVNLNEQLVGLHGRPK